MKKILEIRKKIYHILKIVKNYIANKSVELYEWYKEYESKRALLGAISAWVLTFVTIIIVCRLTNADRLSVDANETTTVKVEVESTLETTDLETSEKTTASEITTEIKTTEQQTTAETGANVERETVDVSKLSVSTTPLTDDNEMTANRFVSINSADIKTVTSATCDKTQFSYGIDISYHQGKIDWAKVKAAGVEYAFIRVGNRGYETGKLCKDSRFDENIQGAINNGIKVGVYFFSQALTEQEALEEASLTLSHIRKYNITLPVVIDWETDKGYRTYSGLSQSKLTSIISTFCDTVKSYGYEPMVYMCKDDFVNRINTSTITSKYKSWVAWYFKEYTSNNYASNIFKYGDLLPDMTFDYYMWQYSAKGRIDGISELVDMNIMILPKIKYNPKLNISKASFTTNMNTKINILEGVTATDSSNVDATAKVTTIITNSSNKQVTKENAFKVSDTYTITYSYKDVDGSEITKNAKLYIRNKPEIYYDGILWSDDKEKEVIYEYDNSLDAASNYDKISTLINGSFSAIYYDILADNSNKHTITNASLSGLELIINDNKVNAGDYKITYTASDGKGMTLAKTIKLVINKQEEETTSEEGEETLETESYRS